MTGAGWCQIFSNIGDEIRKDHLEQNELRINHYDDPAKIEKRRSKIVVPLYKIHRRLLFKCGENTEIWLVRGWQVRKMVDIDFTMGGHEYRYLYIPPKEVWIDDSLAEKDLLPTIYHELYERSDMAEGINYNFAHDCASRLEMAIRRKKKSVLNMIERMCPLRSGRNSKIVYTGW